MKRAFLITTVALLAAGCATTYLRVTRVDPKDPATMVGVPYPLMFTRYQVEVTRQVTECGPELKVIVKAEVKVTEAAPDPKQLFVLDPNSLANAMKTSEVKLEYQPNGAVSSLNATAEDKTGTVISNIASSLFKVVSISAAAGAAPGASAEACSKAVLDARAAVAKHRPLVEAASKVVDGLTAELKALLAKVAASSGNADEATKKAVAAKYDSLTLANEDLKEKSETLARALKVVTHVETLTWPNDGDTDASEFALPQAVFKRWGAVDDNPTERRKFAAQLRLSPVGQHGRSSLAQTQTVMPELGVPYRLPVTAKLTVCAGQPCGPDSATIAEKVGEVLQYGHVFYLPCESRTFTSIGCSFAMTEAGQLKSMGTVQKAAAAEGAAAALKDFTTQAGALQETLSTADTKKLQAKTALLKAEADYAAAVAALQPDVSKPDKDQTAILKAQTDLLNAQRAQLEAQAALDAALSKAGKGP
jgi:hypothetical protein